VTLIGGNHDGAPGPPRRWRPSRQRPVAARSEALLGTAPTWPAVSRYLLPCRRVAVPADVNPELGAWWTSTTNSVPQVAQCTFERGTWVDVWLHRSPGAVWRVAWFQATALAARPRRRGRLDHGSTRMRFFVRVWCSKADATLRRSRRPCSRAEASARAGDERHPALANDDGSGRTSWPSPPSRPGLADGIAAVLRAGACLLMGHRSVFLLRGARRRLRASAALPASPPSHGSSILAPWRWASPPSRRARPSWPHANGRLLVASAAFRRLGRACLRRERRGQRASAAAWWPRPREPLALRLARLGGELLGRGRAFALSVTSVMRRIVCSWRWPFLTRRRAFACT